MVDRKVAISPQLPMNWVVCLYLKWVELKIAKSGNTEMGQIGYTGNGSNSLNRLKVIHMVFLMHTTFYI